MTVRKGFLRNVKEEHLLPITRAELVLDKNGKVALTSPLFEASETNQYGLISYEYLKKINGTGADSLDVVGQKLNAINNSIKIITNSPSTTYNINLYTSNENSATSIPLTLQTDSTLSITKDDYSNTFTMALPAVHKSISVKDTIVKGITVDKYGRVTEIQNSKLNNTDIPQTLTGKTLSNSYTTQPVDNDHIANKKYVDDTVNNLGLGITGALLFKGGMETASEASTALARGVENSYYKATGSFKLSNIYVSGETGPGEYTVKIGDTLILHTPEGSSNKVFTIIPSGDDLNLYVSGTEGDALPMEGNAELKFTGPVTVSRNGNGAKVSLNQASAASDGYLSNTDYIKFSNYANSLLVQYSPSITESNPYKVSIGTLTIGSDSVTVYGQDTITNYSYSTTDNELTFSKQVQDSSMKIKFLGNGISVASNLASNIQGNAYEITLTPNLSVEEQTVEFEILDKQQYKSKFLQIGSDNKTLGVKIGKVSDRGEIIADGLIDARSFADHYLLMGMINTYFLEVDDMSDIQSSDLEI